VSRRKKDMVTVTMEGYDYHAETIEITTTTMRRLTLMVYTGRN
jgi:hypothetical protein